MKPEAQRIAIAESVGWTNIREDGGGAILIGTLETRIDTDRVLIQRDHSIPDSINDLNTMQSALLHIGIHDRENLKVRVKFIGHLREVIGRRIPRNKTGASLMSDVDLVTAASSELAEAYLKTIGRWEA